MKKYFAVITILLAILSACTYTVALANDTLSPIESLLPPILENTENLEPPLPNGHVC